jgi:L-ribulose-5-phosphate 4-epimerase
MQAISEKDLQEAAKSFRWAAQRAFRLGLQASTGGNISIRISPDRVLTKPTGIGLTECSHSDLVLVNARGYPLEGYDTPTKDVQVHLAIFQVRSDVHGIVHYHSPFATAYAVRGLALPLPTLHARRILNEVPLIAEYPEGSTDLAAAVARACEDVEVVGLLMANHGLMAVGPNLHQAQYRAELMEESARIGWLSHSIR